MSIEERRSIRKYTNQPVEKAVIEEVIRAAALAPSAKNRQPWKYLVYAGAEKEKLVDQMEIGLYREREGKSDPSGIGFWIAGRLQYTAYYAGSADDPCGTEYERQKSL